MATTVIVYPSGTTSNSNPHVLFSGGTGATYTIEMTTTGELLFSQDVDFTSSGTLPNISGNYVSDMLYDVDNDDMYIGVQSSISPYPFTISGYSGSDNTPFNTTYADDIYGVNMVKGSTNIIYVLSEFTNALGGDVVVKRINTSTNQITHEYTGGTTLWTRGIYYEQSSSGYVAFSERYNSDNVLTILNGSDLTLVGRYSYDEYAGDPNNYIKDLFYSNGKLLWTMPNRSIQDAVGCSSAYGTFNLSTNVFTTGSTQLHTVQNTEYQLLDGTEKIYGSQNIWYNNGSSAPITGITYGYYDFSNNTFTEIDKKENASGFVDYDAVRNGDYSAKNGNNGDIYFGWLYDLIIIDGTNGNVLDTVDLPSISEYTHSNRVTIFSMAYNDSQNKLWMALYDSTSTTTGVEFFS